MSWDSYITNIKGHAGGACDRATIIGLDGSLWMSANADSNMNLKPAEAQTLGRAFTSGDYTTFQANGVHVEGVKYQFLRADDNIVLAKKKDHGAVSMQKSKKAIVIGHTKEGEQQAATNKGVGVIAEYLESLDM